MLCRIGDVEIWRILELEGPFLTPDKLFPNAGPDVAKIIETHAPGSVAKGTGSFILPVQGFLMKTPSHVILVDGCIGNHKNNPSIPSWHQRNDGRFMAALTAAGIGPEDVDYMLCTHLHVDHVGWNTQLLDGRWVPTFPNAKYLFPEADNEAFGAEGDVKVRSTSYAESVLPVIAAGQAEMVGPDHKLGEYVTLLPTPGHTPGHVSILIKSGDAEAMITGDAIHTSAQCWHPDWHFKFDQDPEMAQTSRKWLLEQASEANWRVLGSHFRLPSIGRIKANGDVFNWDED